MLWGGEGFFHPFRLSVAHPRAHTHIKTLKLNMHKTYVTHEMPKYATGGGTKLIIFSWVCGSYTKSDLAEEKRPQH